MKYINRTFFVSILLLFSINVFAQNPKTDIINFYAPLVHEKSLNRNNYLNKYAKQDFSVVWNYHKNDEYLGFIGDDYQRIRIKILSTAKDKKKLQTYLVNGKSAINNEIKPFQGMFTIKQIKLLTEMRWGIDDESLVSS